MSDFFDEYPDFNYDPTESAPCEFRRLCRWMSWERDDPEQKEAWESFRDALTMQFNANYGTDENELGSWQTLCANLGIHPVPEELKEAREAVYNTHVNLVDLTEGFDGIEVFPTEKALSEYTLSTGKIFPGSSIQAGSLLKALLRFIAKPPPESTRRNEFGKFVHTRGSRKRRGRR